MNGYLLAAWVGSLVPSVAIAWRALNYVRYRDRAAKLTKDCVLLRAEIATTQRRIRELLLLHSQAQTAETAVTTVSSADTAYLKLEWPPLAKPSYDPPAPG